MSDQHAHALLTALRRAAGQVRLYGPDHPLTAAGSEEAARAADQLAAEEGRSVLTILDDSIYLNREVLATTSLEFNGLIRTLQQQGIESITISAPVAAADIGRLAAGPRSGRQVTPPEDLHGRELLLQVVGTAGDAVRAVRLGAARRGALLGDAEAQVPGAHPRLAVAALGVRGV